jgi:hypothetical protein
MLKTMATAAALMYIFDPDQGRRRRTRLRDAAGAVKRDLRRQAGVATRDLRNRARGVVDRALGTAAEPVPDAVLVQRLRARMGHFVRNSGALDVDVDSGRVMLRGPIVARNVAPLLRDLERVPGVRRLDHELEIFPDLESADGLMPEHGIARLDPGPAAANHLTPAGRLVVGGAGAYLVLCGASRHGVTGASLSALGLLAIARVLVDRPTAGPRASAVARAMQLV